MGKLTCNTDWDIEPPEEQPKRWQITQDGYGWHLKEWSLGSYLIVRRSAFVGHVVIQMNVWESREQIMEYIEGIKKSEARAAEMSKVKHQEYVP